jgi:hypothetical protein
MFSLFKKGSEEIVAVFDIGNGSIAGALVKFSVNDQPIILYSHREPLTFAIHATPKHLLGSMLKLLRSVATNLAREGLPQVKTGPFNSHKLRDAYCIFVSPWYISQTKVVRSESEKPVTVSQDTINNLVQQEQEAFNAALREGKYSQIFGPDDRLLEKKVINIRLNGYDIEEPIGKQSKELELTLFSSFISQSIVSGVQEIIHQSFAVRNIHHYSFALAAWSGSRKIFPDIHDYFIVDVSGETTDISLVEKDILVETISFPMGRSTLLRQIVKDLEVTPEVAVSYVGMKSANTLEKNFSDKLDTILKPLQQDWHDQFVVALKTFQKIFALPRATLVTADNDSASFFLKALEEPIAVELNIAQNTLAPTFLSADKVQPFIYELPEVKHDSFIGLESIFLNDIFRTK